MKRLLTAVLFCSLISFLVWGCSPQEEPAESNASVAPDFALDDVEGRIYRLSDFRGDVVILNFFATWCAPCRKEVPDLVRLHQAFAGEGLQIIGVSLDEDGDTVLKPFIKQYGITYQIVLATEKTIFDYGGMQAIPSTFLIDHRGSINEHFVGLAPGYQLESSVRRLLKKRG